MEVLVQRQMSYEVRTQPVLTASQITEGDRAVLSVHDDGDFRQIEADGAAAVLLDPEPRRTPGRYSNVLLSACFVRNDAGADRTQRCARPRSKGRRRGRDASATSPSRARPDSQ